MAFYGLYIRGMIQTTAIWEREAISPLPFPLVDVAVFFTVPCRSIVRTTVDGSEIWRSPVDMVNIPLFTGFYTCWVVQAFFHQQS